MNDKITIIPFKNDFINGKAKTILLNSNENKYIIKGSTGIGGTTAILNDTSKSWVIVSPNKGMIKSKENDTYKSKEQFFIYGETNNIWENVNEFLINNSNQNCVINCTPDQIVILKNTNPELYTLITQMSVFIDEAHAFTQDAGYRDNMGYFKELAYNEWIGSITLSSATPNYQNFDLPIDKNITLYKIVRIEQPIKKLQISNTEKDAYNFIFNEVDKGHTVCVFSNNINYHKKQFDTITSTNLVGDTLKVKLLPFKKGNDLPTDKTIFINNDIIFLSSSYYAGYDIPINCSVVIISNTKDESTTISVNNAVQCYGRVRETMLNALYINELSPHQNTPTIKNINAAIDSYKEDVAYYQRKAKQLEHWDNTTYGITPHYYANRAQLGTPVLNLINNYQLSNEDVFNTTLQGYGFELSKYQPVDVLELKTSAIPFKERITNLLQLGKSELLKKYEDIKNNIRIKDKGSYSYSLSFEYLTAYILLNEDPKQILQSLNNKRVQPFRFYNSLDLYIRVNGGMTNYYNDGLTPNQITQADNKYKQFFPLNSETNLVRDWVYLYAIYKVKNNILNPEIKDYMEFYEAVGATDIINDLKKDKHRYIKALRSIKKQVEINPEKEIEANKLLREYFSKIDKKGRYNNQNTEEKLKKQMVAAIGYLYNSNNYKVTEKKHRVYTPITSLPTNLRSILPWKLVEIDITSANPQFTDRIIESTIAFDVYKNIMEAKGVTRAEAKTMYNTFLNNYKARRSTSYKFYHEICRYTPEQAGTLSELTASGVKAQYYMVMVREEEMIINNYQTIIGGERFHDAILLPLWECEDKTLLTSLNGYRFHIGYFNNNGNYEGKVNHDNVVNTNKSFC